MPGPLPKPASTRQRTNRTSTAAMIQADPKVRAPKLPAHPNAIEGEDWHDEVKAWWRDAWKSPMASEFTESDKHGLFLIARLRDGFWKAGSARSAAEIGAEIRLQEQRYGFSPMDRRRLQWQIVETEDKQERQQRRRQAEPKPKPAPQVPDPRAVLRSVQ